MTDLVLLGDRDLGYVTHRELAALVERLPADVHATWLASDDPAVAERAAAADGLWLIPGSPYRDDAAVLAAITSARTTGRPFLGTCGGFQYAMVEFARNVAGIVGAAHAETEPAAAEAVVAPLACRLVGEERLVTAVPGTRFHDWCGGEPFTGFHYCSFGLAEAFVDRLTAHGLVVAARAPDAGVEAVELPGHPFFVATLFQPQVGASRGEPIHPLIHAFLAAAGGAASA